MRKLALFILISTIGLVLMPHSRAQTGSGFEDAIAIEPSKNNTNGDFLSGRTKFYKILPSIPAGRQLTVNATFWGQTGLVGIILYSERGAALAEISQIVTNVAEVILRWVTSDRDGGRPFYVRFSSLSELPVTFEFNVHLTNFSDVQRSDSVIQDFFDAGESSRSAAYLGKLEIGSRTRITGYLTGSGLGSDFGDVYKFDLSAIPSGEKAITIRVFVKLDGSLQAVTTLMNARENVIGKTEFENGTIVDSISRDVYDVGTYFVKLWNRDGAGGTGSYELSIQLFPVEETKTTATSAFPTRIPIVFDPTSLGFTVTAMGIVAIVVVAFVAAALRRRKIYRVE